MGLARSYRSLRAGVALFATVVGVGVFALPYVFSRAGFLVGLAELVGLAFFELLLLLMYAEITVQTPGRQRFGGYMGHYLGPIGRTVASVTILVSMFVSLIAFTILGGRFLAELSGWPTVVSAGCVVLAVAILTSGGLKALSKVSVYITGVMVALYGAVIVAAIPSIRLEHLTTVSHQPADLLLPYGVIIFALAGLGAIPEMHDILERQFSRLPRVVIGSYAAIVLLYAAFAFAVVGASGAATSTDAISGLASLVHPTIALLGTVLGLVSVISIQSMVGLEFMEALRFDIKISKTTAWLIGAFAPFLFFLAGLREFVTMIGFVGTVFAGIIGILVVAAYERMKRTAACKQKKCLRIPTWLSLLVAIVFLFGLVIGI